MRKIEVGSICSFHISDRVIDLIDKLYIRDGRDNRSNQVRYMLETYLKEHEKELLNETKSAK